MTDKDKRFRLPWGTSSRRPADAVGTDRAAEAPTQASAERLQPGWRGVVLVCSECEGRDDGPHGLRAKEVRKQLKMQPRDGAGKLKVVTTDCLGPCPRKAMTLIVSGAAGPLEVYGLRSADQAIDCVRQATSGTR